AWFLNILVLALPIPFDNLLPAWAILFFCLALIEDDGVMAMLGWLLTLLTAVWTAFLLMIGRAAIMTAMATVRQVLFDGGGSPPESCRTAGLQARFFRTARIQRAHVMSEPAARGPKEHERAWRP